MNSAENSHDQFHVEAMFQVSVDGQHSCAQSPPAGSTIEQFPHKHTFVVRGGRPVKFSENEVWPHVIRQQVKEYLRESFRETPLGIPDFENLTCAALAKMVLLSFNLLWCEVLADDEAGARVFRDNF